MKDWLSYSDFKFLILSRGRSETIKSHIIFPNATIVCPESEQKDYEKYGLKVEPCPDNIIGLSLLRNYCIKKYKEKVVVMIDDDIFKVVRFDYITPKDITNDTNEIIDIVMNTGQCAYDLGTRVFGFDQSMDIRKYNSYEPFTFKGWVGGIIGVIGTDNLFIDNKFKVDIDFCLEALLHDRVIWKDNRISFLQVRDRNKGGNSVFRTKEQVDEEEKKLKKKWGKYIKFKETKSGRITTIEVKRTERFSL